MKNATPTARFADSSNNQKYVEVLIDVQNAICAGDFDQAGRLCDASLDLAEGLSVVEVHWMQNLSSDLEALCGEELLQNNPYSSQEYQVLLEETWTGIEDAPDDFLRLLRFEQGVLPPVSKAYARGRAYSLLGFLNAACVFTRMASELDPQQPFYKMALITILNNQKRFEELDKELRHILIGPIADPDLIVNAAAIFLNRAIKASADLDRISLGELRQRLQQVFGRNSLRALRPSTAVLGFHTLGSIQDRLHRPAKAQEFYRQALTIDPQNQAVRISLALSLLQDNETEAYQIFNQVADEGTSFELAYLMAGKLAGERGLFTQSSAMAQKAIEVTESAMVCAFAYEMLAISEAEINGPNDKAGEYFLEALRLAPDNTHIYANYSHFQGEFIKVKEQPKTRNQSGHKRPSIEWLVPNTENFYASVKANFQVNEDRLVKSLPGLTMVQLSTSESSRQIGSSVGRATAGSW